MLYTDDDRDPTPDDEKEYKKRKKRQQERAMEGAGMIRAHTEKVYLKNNIFAEEEPSGNQDAQESPGGNGDDYPMNEDEVNPLNMAELAEVGDIA